MLSLSRGSYAKQQVADNPLPQVIVTTIVHTTSFIPLLQKAVRLLKKNLSILANEVSGKRVPVNCPPIIINQSYQV